MDVATRKNLAQPNRGWQQPWAISGGSRPVRIRGNWGPHGLKCQALDWPARAIHRLWRCGDERAYRKPREWPPNFLYRFIDASDYVLARPVAIRGGRNYSSSTSSPCPHERSPHLLAFSRRLAFRNGCHREIRLMSLASRSNLFRLSQHILWQISNYRRCPRNLKTCSHQPTNRPTFNDNCHRNFQILPPNSVTATRVKVFLQSASLLLITRHPHLPY
ncbi:hypothetical protein B0T14DRAFT_103969 [Immersiella caudata]|uniref:Uncharacterized protein n=1 Tax=Immersiella caudata TaxID=314043 RepID=A0AA39X382_9PEZI|nr:hypothetical protein B0T14DRAFT_103969 [Immersiella caudata]